MIDLENLRASTTAWASQEPYPHAVVDGFFEGVFAKKLEAEFPNFDAGVWNEYNNQIEIKKTCNNWNAFPENTYRILNYMNSPDFVSVLSDVLFGQHILFPDPGLNGGGWHIHSSGGKLNTHLDYSLHPKLKLQRKINIIVYLNSEWRSEWGGSLGLWSNESNSAPGELVKEIAPEFNRAVIFDTTMNSWHGLPQPIDCPANQYRKSIAIYYLCQPGAGVDARGKALFAPTEEQKSNPEILELIKKRSQIQTAHETYKE